VITIVSGYQRCGSSLMLQMLSAAGVPVFHDEGMGYPSFETHNTTDRASDPRWLDGLDGYAVKWLEPKHTVPPVGFNPDVRVLWMKRDYSQQAKSAVKFMHACGFECLSRDMRLVFAASYKRDEDSSLALWRERGAVHVQQFEQLIENPQQAAVEVCAFLNLNADVDRMAAVVRQRQTDCLPYMLEMTLIADRENARPA
jgi:hypothetical protein